MDNSFVNSPFGLRVPEKYTHSFGRFLLDATDNLKLLMGIKMLDGFKYEAIEKINELARDPNNIELYSVDKNTLEAESRKIFDAETYERVLGQMTFCRFIDNFLCYLKEVIAEVIKVSPSVISAINPNAVDDADDLQKVEDEIDRVFKMNFPKIKSLFKNKLAIDILEKDIRQLTVFIKERNIIVHNRATVSDELIELEPALDGQKGKHIHFKLEQLAGILFFLNNISINIDKLLADKYNLELLGSYN